MQVSNEIGRTRIKPVEQGDLFLHCAIFLAPGSGPHVLSDETFRLVAVQGQEAISTPFEFTLTLHGNSKRPDNDPLLFTDIIGRRVTFGIERPHDVNDDPVRVRLRFREALAGVPAPTLSLFNGIATTFAMNEPGVYRMTVKPALWKLMLTNRYCIYPQSSIVGAIAAVFRRYPDVAVSFGRLNDPHNIALARTQDWLQAGETDYEFVQRLMAKAHLYYYVEHRAREHIVVFDNTAQYPEIQNRVAMRYTFTSAEPLGQEQADVVTEYGYEQTLTHSGVQSMFVREEAAWEKDTVARLQTFPPLDTSAPGELPFQLYKIYQYGCSQSMTSEFAKATESAIKAAASQFNGASHCAFFRVGYKFRTVEGDDKDSVPAPVRPTLNDKWFVLTQVKHEASLDGTYRNEFVATEADGLVTPVTIRDTHQGSVLATVVAVGNHGMPPDNWKYYAKNNFDPEYSTATDTESEASVTSLTGVYVRFSSDGADGPKIWVKLAPHMQTVPEIGTNVIIGRANDESEMPEVQNIVQANGQMTVTPCRWTADTRVGSTYSTSYGDGKSIRFGKDSKVELQKAIDIINREYDSGMFSEVGYSKGQRFNYETSEQGRDGTLSKSESYGSTYSRSEAAERKSYEEVGYTRSEQKIGNSDSYSTTTGKSYNESSVGESESHHTVERTNTGYETVKGKNSTTTHYGSTESHLTVDGESKSYETFQGDRYSKSDSSRNIENHSSVGGDSKSYETVSGERYGKSTVGKATNYDTCNGKRYNSSITNGNADSYSIVTGVESATNHVGVSNRNSAIGLSNDNSLIGASNSNSVVGVSVDNRAAVATWQMSAALRAQSLSAHVNATNINIVSTLSNVNVVGMGLEYSNKAGTSEVEQKGMSVTLLQALKMFL